MTDWDALLEPVALELLGAPARRLANGDTGARVRWRSMSAGRGAGVGATTRPTRAAASSTCSRTWRAFIPKAVQVENANHSECFRKVLQAFVQLTFQEAGRALPFAF